MYINSGNDINRYIILSSLNKRKNYIKEPIVLKL